MNQDHEDQIVDLMTSRDLALSRAAYFKVEAAFVKNSLDILWGFFLADLKRELAVMGA